MLILGYLGAVGMGLTLGMIGAGGSILAVPILAYLFGVPGIQATYESLFVVGVSAAVGAIPFARQNRIEFKLGFLFFFPSVAGVLLSRRLFLPAIPSPVELGSLSMAKDLFILLLFGLVMLAASISMIRGSATPSTPAQTRFSRLKVIIVGHLVGVITGLVGVGGGFLIVPALVRGLSLPMERAVGTSLFIIALNSLSGFSSDWIAGMSVDWSRILPFTLIALLGVMTGTVLNRKIPGAKLKPAFGWFLLLLSIGIVAKQLT